MIDIGKLNPAWMTDLKKENVFDAYLTFNRTEWYKEANYKKYVKKEEDHSIGGLNPGMYRLLEETFCLNICSSAATEEDVLK